MDLNSKIYVAGHKGLVGSYLLEKIISEGYTNILTMDSSRMDLRDEQAVNKFFEENKPEYVFLVAARHGGVAEYAKYPVEMFVDNSKIETNIIMNCWKHGIKKLVFVAASCVYCQNSSEFTEEALFSGWVQQSTEPYALAKAIGIKLCDYCNREYGTKFVSVLPVNVYGITDEKHHDTTSVVPAMLERFADAAQKGKESVIIWGDGKTQREFIHARDLADAIVRVMDSNIDNGWVNIGSGNTVSIDELAKIIAKVTGFEGRIEHDLTKPKGSDRKALDLTKIKSTGWKPSILLEDGLADMYDRLYGRNR